MFSSKSPYVFLSVALVCCALALGFVPQMANLLSGDSFATSQRAAGPVLNLETQSLPLVDVQVPTGYVMTAKGQVLSASEAHMLGVNRIDQHSPKFLAAISDRVLRPQDMQLPKGLVLTESGVVMSQADAFMRGLKPLPTRGTKSHPLFQNTPMPDRGVIIAAVPGSPKAAAYLDEGSYTDVETALEESIQGRDVYKVVEQMPLFPGKKCGDKFDFAERKACSDQAMLKYIYANIRYPKKARDRGVQGLAVVTFVVEAHGAISDIELVRDPGAGIGKAVKKMVKQMAQDNPRWEPGINRGKPVAVQFALPVKFKLEGKCTDC